MSRKFQFCLLDALVQDFIKQNKFYLYKVIIGLPFRNKDHFCCDQHGQTSRTVSFLSIKILHTKEVQNCTILLGLGYKTLSFKKRYLAK